MSDLSTTYLGLSLKNPLIAASSRLTGSVEKVIECEKAGAGAIVLKSLFEEQIKADTEHVMESIDTSVHADAYDFFASNSQARFMDEYLDFAEQAVKSVSIPVIASLNCVSTKNWKPFADKLQATGVKALEVNVFIMPSDMGKTGQDIEKQYLDIVRQLKKSLSVPFALKIGPHFSGMADMMHVMIRDGAAGLVLFNRFYRPDIDIKNLKIIPARVLSAAEENALVLHWIALMSGELQGDLCATTGIHDTATVIKQLLAGAKAVQLCSALMRNGVGYITTVLDEIKAWMREKNFKAIKDFNGMLCQEKHEHPEIFERSQYIKALTGMS
jgi:dihydroorotate dehydrogenase (fumarate)